jgi:hypothetical protein
MLKIVCIARPVQLKWLNSTSNGELLKEAVDLNSKEYIIGSNLM